MAIYDLRSLAARTCGFIKRYPHASPDMLRRFFETVEQDQKKDSIVLSRYDQFSQPMQVILKRYASDIDALYAQGKRAKAIETALLQDYPKQSPKTPKKSTIEKYIGLKYGKSKGK